MKHGVRWEKGMISFTSIAPDEKLFDLDNVKRAFLDRMSLEGEILLNYGYAKGYKPLIDYLMRYMETKGVDLTGKDLLVTNGFTEGLDLVLSAVHKPHRRVLCETRLIIRRSSCSRCTAWRSRESPCRRTDSSLRSWSGRWSGSPSIWPT